MRVLLFSDLHLDTPFRWAGPELARRRRQALRETLCRLCDLAVAEGVDALLCAGDLYEHDRFTPDTGRFLRETFARLDPLPVLLAPGNHDWYGPQSIYCQQDWTPNVHVYDSARLTPYELADGLTLWGAAHCAPANTDGFFDHGFRIDRGGVNLALFHGSERSELRWQEDGKAPHAPFAEAQIPAAGLQHAFCGHFHTPRDAAWHTYPGNPDPLTFGEAGERGAVLAEVTETGEVLRTRHRVAVSQVHDAEVDLTGVAHSHEARERVAAAVSKLAGVVRVTLFGEVDPDVDLQEVDWRGVGGHLEALVPRFRGVQVAYDLEELRGEPSVRGEFIRDVEADPTLDHETKRKVIVTGLRALSGRRDELEVV
jgi:DNA repair exonuclease SbcCD nuclease subunit